MVNLSDDVPTDAIMQQVLQFLIILMSLDQGIERMLLVNLLQE